MKLSYILANNLETLELKILMIEDIQRKYNYELTRTEIAIAFGNWHEKS